MTKIMIVGAGEGGTKLLPILHGYKEIEITGVSDVREDAPGLVLARELGIATAVDYKALMSQVKVDIIVDVSGNEAVTRELCDLMATTHVEVLQGQSANILYKLIDERRGREEEAMQRLREQEALYRIGIMLTSSESEDELLNTILECATQLTDTPAGSIALYDDVDGCMELVAAHGLSKRFTEGMRWEVRKGGLTERILNQTAALVVGNVADHKEINNPEIQEEGIQALIAMPLIAERKTKGILYVDDFKPREFGKKDESILALLSTQAAIAIEKMQLFERVKRLAITDGLTGLYNHRYFIKTLAEELKRTKRYNHSLSVLLLDVDHFKHYNDTNGHLKGNEVLRKVTEVMKKTLRKVDVLARYGGEEFAVILPETNKEQGLRAAQRICEAVEKEHFSGEEKQPLKKLTVSAGVATFPDDAKRQMTLVDRADCALYEAKRQGRNQAVAFTSN